MLRRRAVVLVGLALGLLALPAMARNDTQLIIMHHAGHTGSHALCQLLGSLSCVQASCDELQFNGDEVKRFRVASDRPIALRMYRMKRAHRRGGSSPLDDLKAQKLVRFMPQIRTDLMRWALSEYCKTGARLKNSGVTKQCFEKPDPQFRNATAEGLHTYNVTSLAKIAKALVKEWRSDTDIAHMGFPKDLTQFVFYEDLLQGEEGGERQLEAYGRWILEKLNLKYPKGCHRNVTRYLKDEKEVVEKVLSTYFYPHPSARIHIRNPNPSQVHPNDIGQFVKNADAVRELFTSNFGKDENGKDRVWPQWKTVASELGVSSKIRGHWNSNWHSTPPARSVLAAAETEASRSKLAATPASERDASRSASRSADHRQPPRQKARTVAPPVQKVRTVSALTPPNPLDLLDIVRWS